MHSQKWESDNGQKAIVVLTDRHVAERRRHVRFPLKALARFSWENPGVGVFFGEGFTRDVSGNGAFIFSSTCPTVGAIVRVEISLPRVARVTTFRIAATMRPRRVECAVSPLSESGFSVEGRMFMARRLLRAIAKIA
jgi:PilZ domain-containing protein